MWSEGRERFGFACPSLGLDWSCWVVTSGTTRAAGAACDLETRALSSAFLLFFFFFKC